jgi:Lysozyme like domain/Bacterial TSP3 repeat
MATLTASQIYTLLLQGGFDPQQARMMTAIAQAESARNPGAIGDVALQTGTWGPSVGLFQIRTLKAETGTGSDRDIQRLMNNPAEQVKAALKISGGGSNYRPWSTYTNGAYRKFLDEPLQGGAAIPSTFGSGAAPVGAGPYGAAAFATNGADPFAMAPVPQPSGITDQDGDGLTDDFEKLFGTDATKGDSDADGLTDAHETSASHTDPLSADTDRDGQTDAAEVAAGADAGRAEIPAAARAAGFGGTADLDTDADGLSDGYEQKYGTDPLLADSDGDGLSDGTEIARGLNPRLLDSDNDGLADGFAADNNLVGGGPAAPAGPALDPYVLP